jgi:hypothetical protein
VRLLHPALNGEARPLAIILKGEMRVPPSAEHTTRTGGDPVAIRVNSLTLQEQARFDFGIVVQELS